MTIKNRYPLPLIQETLACLQKARWYTKLDLRDGYYHLRIAEGEEWKTAFRTRYGHFEYQVMPFGLTNSPGSAASSTHKRHDQGFLDVFCTEFLDDILIYSSTLQENKEHVRLLERLSGRHPFETGEFQVPRPSGGLSQLSHHANRPKDARRKGGHDPGLRGLKEREGREILFRIRQILPAVHPELLQGVCNVVFAIPLHAARRAMAAAPPLPKQRQWAFYVSISLAPDRPSRS